MGAFAIIDRAVAALISTLSALRGRRIFHPYGLAYTGTVTITHPPGRPTESVLLGSKHTYPAIIRFSRGSGLPQPLPDILGIAIRVLDIYGPGQHQDLLFAASGNGWIANRLLLFATGYFTRPFSSILTYHVGSQLLLFGLLPPSPPPKRGGTDLEELRDLAQRGQLHYRLAIATPTQRFTTIGTLQVTAEASSTVSEQLRFNPWHTGGGIAPVGFLNRLRRSAYRASQQGRAASKVG
jgi:hypothetical protein